MTLDTAFLSRVQFAFTISFHILFPAFSIGLSTFLAVMEGFWIKTRNPLYLNICKFWVKIFALTFGMGIVSGIVMEFQLGTNWSRFTLSAGGVLGVLFTYEVMTAFFIEAGFLGVMLFGWNKVGPKLHYTATLLVTMGTTASAYWILCANTWMQHPVGYALVKGMFVPTDWYQIIFSPALFPRFIHMMFACYLSAGFVILSVSAYYLLKNKHINFARKCFSVTGLFLILLAPAQIIMGDATGVEVHENQPIKTAAIEGIWDTQKGAPLLLFALPDQQNQKNNFSIGIPHFSSLLNTHSWNGEMVGLKSVSPSDQPNVAIVFWTFRIMVAAGFAMLFLAVIGLYLRLKKRLFDTRWYLKLCVLSSPLGFVAMWCGWITAEIGRQPWIVYGVIRTADGVSKILLRNVIISFGLIIIVYGVIFGYFYFKYLSKIISKGPDVLDVPEADLPFQYMPITNTSKGEQP
ncbi:MAG: cytochrome ubiquinol oxidase subunit I [Gammaproteobacteria bacterium]|nr:cytochrome ubiquinol oxidase subunit I [Gammaproteobacteria bacterium]